MLNKLALLTITLLIFSCKKELPAPQNQNCLFHNFLTENNSEASTEIILGDSANMYIFKSVDLGLSIKDNFTISAQTDNATLLLDVDCDGVSDFKFTSSITPFSSYYITQWLTMKVECLNESSFLHFEGGIDTTFYSRDTLYNSTDPVYKVITDYYKCYAGSLTDSIVSVSDQQSLSKFLDITTVTTSDNWINETGIIHDSDGSPRDPDFGPFNSDTTLLYSTRLEKSCKNMPNNIEHYIPFKKIINGNEKLGWFKVVSNGTTTLSIKAIAMQK